MAAICRPMPDVLASDSCRPHAAAVRFLDLAASDQAVDGSPYGLNVEAQVVEAQQVVE